MPTLVVMSSLARPASRRARIAVAAPQSASRRRLIGVVPAWFASPVKRTRKPISPTIPVTIPISMPSVSSTGPCSMCSSRYPPSSSDSARARNALEVEAELGHRLAKADAVGVTTLGRVRADPSPTNARLPKSAAPKRAPSSSMNEISQSGLRRLDPALLEEADRLETARGRRARRRSGRRSEPCPGASRRRSACQMPASQSSDQIPRCVDFDLEP